MEKASGFSATRIILLMMIVGLVGASGYLIYNKLRPGTPLAVGSKAAADKDAEKDDKKKDIAGDPDKGDDKPKQEEHVGEKPHGHKTLEEGADLDGQSPTLAGQEEPPTEDENVKSLEEPGNEPVEPIAEKGPSKTQRILPEDSPGVTVQEASQTRTPGKINNRAKEEAHSELRQVPGQEEDPNAEGVVELGPENASQQEPAETGQPVRTAQNQGARSPGGDRQPIDTPSLADTGTGGNELEAVPTIPEEGIAGSEDPRLQNFEAAEPVPEAVARKGTRPVGIETQPVAKVRGAQLAPEIETQEPSEQFPARKHPLPAKSISKATGGTDPTSEKYIVQPNDNFWLIAKKTYGSARYFKALMKYNESRANDPYMLKPGLEVITPTRETLQKLHPELIDLNPSERKGSKGGNPETSEAEPSGMFVGSDGTPMYRVGSDDTLGSISQKHLGRFSRYPEIYEVNKDVMESPDKVKPGLVLRLPQDASQVRVVMSPRPEFSGNTDHTAKE